MKIVGIRELKNRLSEYLRDVRARENVPVTDRGDVIAELSPPGQVAAESYGLRRFGSLLDADSQAIIHPSSRPGVSVLNMGEGIHF
jgi:antitoxin (DNA-binding transcriptional repressor) of toxin-antitoxin stability system